MRQGDNIDFSHIYKTALKIADCIKRKRKQLLSVLTTYETYRTAEDEIERTLDLLTSLEENRLYFKEVVGPVAVFMPSNQPLYSFACFAIIPAFMSERVCVKPPEIMKDFYEEMLQVLNIKELIPNIEYIKLSRKDCVTLFTATKMDYETNRRQPVFEAAIFTGTTQNADKLRKSFHRSTLFITNGSGHNPLVVTDTADLEKAIKSIVRVRTYNQGQDCAAPNTILVHAEIYDSVLAKLREVVSQLKIGPYSSPLTDIGPISRPESLPAIKEFLVKNKHYIDESTDGIIRARTCTIEPTIITKPLKDGANFEELFAPIFVLQRYDRDADLNLYFEHEKYRTNAMYITIYGESSYIDSFSRSAISGKILHDRSTIIHDTDLHEPGVERGINPYGGYGRGASCISKDGVIVSCPTLPQRELYEYLACKNNINARKTIMSNEQSTRQIQHEPTENKHWGERIAERVLEQFPDEEVYTCAAGISPSGIVHFGNFRDLFTPYVVAESLAKKGKKTRLIFSWDDFDRFRKVPKNVDPSFSKYIGLPYTEVPCPDGKYASYAEKFEKEFEASIEAMGIHSEYIYQTDMYRSGVYDDLIIHSLQNREAIADILLSFMPEKTKIAKSIEDKEYRDNYYPVILYSRFTGKDNTKILGYDGKSTVTYKCLETGNTESVDITKEHIVKLSWKIDWPMRWGKENVVFEPAGADHASPGGSFDTSSRIAREIFNITPPVFEEYKFVGRQGLGSKMSGSKGNVVAPQDLLDIYTPEMLKWLYADKAPGRSFELSFGKGIFRQYDEFDRIEEDLKNGTLGSVARETLRLSGSTPKSIPPIPFRQVLGLGQIVQWNEEKLREILDNQGVSYDSDSISARLPRARAWLEKYNQEEAISLIRSVNTTYLSTMSPEQIENIKRLHDFLVNNESASLQTIETEVYAIPKKPGVDDMKELARSQRAFFKDVYNLLIGNDIGPRLSTFLWASDRQKVVALLNTEQPL